MIFMIFLKKFVVDLLGAQMIFMIFLKSFGVDLLDTQMIFMIFLNELQHVYWAVNIMRIYKAHNHETFKEQISLSIWDSVKGTKRCFCYLLDPELEGVWYRRYTCVSCPRCLELDFLNCTNEGAGVWNFKPFEIQSGILYKLFDPVFGVAQMTQWFGKSKEAKAKRKKKSLEVKRLIVSYLRCIILE